MPEVSIIMPAYNVSNYIAKAIESVLLQTFSDWELLIVNDGSTDNTPSVVQKYSGKDKRIKLLNKSNGGLSDARNFGLAYASGTFIHFFDPDDYLKGEFYSPLVDVAKTKLADVVISGYNVEYQDKYGNSELKSSSCPNEFNLSTYSNSPIKFVCYAWNKLFRLEFLQRNLLKYEVGLSRIEDAEFMSRVVRYNPTIALVKSSTYTYVQRPVESLSKGFDSSVVHLALRRIDIDAILINHFISEKNQKSDIVDFLKQSATISTVNRLYDSYMVKDKGIRYSILKEVSISLLPTHFRVYHDRGIKSVFDRITIWSLKSKMFFIIDLLQLLR